MSLLTIPDLCLLTILDRIPLHDLLSTVNLVCHRWAQVRPVACHRRHSLFLYDNQNYLDHIFEHKFSHDHEVTGAVINDDGTPFDGWIYVQYQLKLNGMRLALVGGSHGPVCEQLLTLLPNISRLQLGQSVTCWPTLIPSVNRLLEKWSTKLVHLNLWLKQDWLYNQSPVSHGPALIDQLFDRLNRLTSLRRLIILALNFKFHDQTFSKPKFISSLSTVLSRVDHFEYSGSCDYKDKVFEGRILADLETVLKGQSSSQLKSITLRPNIPTPDARSRFSARFTSKLTNFVVCLGLEEWLNELVISRLSSIESLYVKDVKDNDSPVDISFADFISKLSHLSRLTFLDFWDFPKCFFKNMNQSQSQPLPQIRSLKALRITFQIPLSHHYISQLAIPSLFPNVQVFKLHQIIFMPTKVACIECNYKLENMIPSVADQPMDGHTEEVLERCSRLTIQPLNKCNSNQTRVIRFVRSGSIPDRDGARCTAFDATYAPGQI